MGHLGKLLQPEKLLGVALAFSCTHADALGFGELMLHSHLGAPLSASVKLNGIDAANASNLCPRSRLESLDGRLLSVPQSTLSRQGDNGEILIRSKENIDEPAATLSVEIGCGATVRREFAILLDPAPGQAASVPGQDASTANFQRKPANASAPHAPETAAVSMKRTAAPREKTKASAKNVLRLSVTAEASMQEGLAAPTPRLKFSDTLSEQRMESDPARRAAMRADQARVAALLRGEDPYAVAESRMRQAQTREQAMLREATLARQQSAADRQALEDEERKHQSSTWIAAVTFVLLALGIGLAWLHRRSAGDNRLKDASFLSSLDADPPEASISASSVQREVQPIQPPFAAETSAPRVVPTFPVSVPEPNPAPAAPPAIIPDKEANALEFGLVWHASNDTVLSPTEMPIAMASPDPGNSLDWLNAAESDAAAGMESEESAARVSELLLAVETWMDDHNPLRAIAMLEPACLREKLSPAPMRYLLELYRIVGEDEKHRATQEAFAAQFPLAFHGASPSWDQGYAQQTLANYPEILADMESLRGEAALLPYLQKLLLCKEGFDFPVYREIMRHIAEAEEMRQERDIAGISLGLDHG